MKISYQAKHALFDWALKISIFGLAAIFFLVFVDGKFFFPPITIESPEALQTVKSQYRVGETVQAYFSFCKKRDTEGELQWYLVNGSLVTYPSRSGNVLKGCYKNKIIDIERIPSHVDLAAEDMLHFEGRIVYKMNAVSEVVVDLKTVPFKVVQ